MNHLLHELGRFCRVLPLEARTRWHAARTVRHERLRRQHAAALDACMTEVDTMLAHR